MFFELILGEMSDMTGYLIPQLSPKREKDSLYNSRNTTHVASISGIYLNYRKHLHKKRIQLLQDWFGTPAWPPFHCFGTPIWPPWRRVKTLYHVSPSARHTRGHFCLSRVSLGLRKKRGCTWSINKTKDMYCIVSLAAVFCMSRNGALRDIQKTAAREIMYCRAGPLLIPANGW